MIDLTDLAKAAPRPWTMLALGTHTGSGGFHLYLVDANGRKIGVVWGNRDEKFHTASIVVEAVNALDPAPAADASIAEIGAALRHKIEERT